jgi:hypothetical protein
MFGGSKGTTHDKAANWLSEGHNTLAYVVNLGMKAGMNDRASREIDAIESAGWKLSNATGITLTTALLVFHAGT